MNMPDKVTKFPIKHTKLRCEAGWEHYTFSFDDKYVTVDCRHPFKSGARQYDLWRLIPTPSVEVQRNEEGVKQFRRGLAFLIATVVVFFSDLRQSVPLFAPALFLVGVIETWAGYFHLRPRTQTSFFGTEGGALVSIPFQRIVEGDREAFIESLSTAIQEARARVYETAEV